jgi:hypothetical protein
MDHSEWFDPKSPYGMTSYKMRDFDMIFHGDAAFVAFVADVESKTPSGPFRRALRIMDFYTKTNCAWIQSGSNTDLHAEAVEQRYQMPRTLSDGQKKKLLEARETIWRAWFGGDRATLDAASPRAAGRRRRSRSAWRARRVCCWTAEAKPERKAR